MEEQSYKHLVGYCDLCDTEMIFCGKCGNNCCNGGYGTLENGLECDACPEAYKKQEILWLTKSANTP